MESLKTDFSEVFTTPTYPVDRTNCDWQVYHSIKLKDP